MVETIISLLVALIVLLAIFYILSIWIYKRAPANMCFIRTGFMGTKVCMGGGAVVLPVFHEVTYVSLETIKLIVSRSQSQAILTADKIRIDVNAELYTHVGHAADAVLTASRSLGEKTFDPDKVRNLLEAKIVSALRSHAATKTLSELHENRDAFAQAIKADISESFKANGLDLEEVTIVALEQTGKEHFKSDNVFDAEGLKIITEITSAAKRKVHETEKRTTVAIRQRDLDTQLELLDIERNEAFARAQQDKDVSNEQALRVGEKQIYVLDQRMSVEQTEIENEKSIEQMRTERDITLLEEARRREHKEIEKELGLERDRRDREIALIAKAKEQELANIERNLELEQADKRREIELIGTAQAEELAQIDRTLQREKHEKAKDIELIGRERERQQAEIERVTVIAAHEEIARIERHKAAEEANVAMRQRTLETRLKGLDLDQEEAVAAARQEQEVASEQARMLSEKQRYLLEQRWEVEQEELAKARLLEVEQLRKEVAVIEESRGRDSADIARQLAREAADRDRQVALLAKQEELDSAEVHRQFMREQEERERDIALVAKQEELERRRVQQASAVELEEREREIALINKEVERERADIERFTAREGEERNREIAMANKTRELEQAEVERLAASAERAKAEKTVESVTLVAEAERRKIVDRIIAEAQAGAQRVDEENRAEINRLHMVTQAKARSASAAEEADATLTRARALSEAQKIEADGLERHAGARGRAEAEVAQRKLEAEAVGIEAKAVALAKYDEGATFLELAKMQIDAEREVRVDQAKAMGSALSNAQIRMYGGGDGTVDTIRSLFTSGFGVGEALEGMAQSLPDGLRERFAKNGIRGLFGKPAGGGAIKQAVDRLEALVGAALPDDADRQVPFSEGLAKLEAAASDDTAAHQALALLKSANAEGTFDDVPFDKVWSLLQATTRAAD